MSTDPGMPKPIRVERKLIHGQEVEVKIYAPGTEGIKVPKLVSDEAAAQLEAMRLAEYQPQFESYKEGLPDPKAKKNK